MVIKCGKQRMQVDATIVMVVVSCMFVLVQLYAAPRRYLTAISLTGRALLVIWVIGAGVMVFLRLCKPFPRSAAQFGKLILLIAIVSVISFVSIKDGFFDVLVKIMGFFALPIMILYAMLFKVDGRVKYIIAVFFVLLSFVFIDLYFSPYRYLLRGEYGAINASTVTLGYNNANLTAILLFVCCIGLTTGFFLFKSFIVKLFLTADLAFMIWIMLQTDSRTTTVLIVVFAAYVVYSIFNQPKPAMLWIALLVPVVYMLVPVFFKDLAKLEFMEDQFLAGREKIYYRYYNQLNVFTALVGDMNTFRLDNLHNSYVAVAASWGIPVCLAYFLAIKGVLLKNMPIHGSSLSERVAFVGVLCLVMQGATEAMFFIGDVTYAFLLFCIYLFFVKPQSCGVQKAEGIRT